MNQINGLTREWRLPRLAAEIAPLHGTHLGDVRNEMTQQILDTVLQRRRR
jgi:hypothetical protein